MSKHDDANATTPWPLPRALNKADGSPRRVGIEFELQGIDVKELAELTAATLGGKVSHVSDVEFDVTVSSLGEFRVEVDFALLKRLSREQTGLDADEPSTVDRATLEMLNKASSVLVPCEVITPPIAMDALSSPMEKLTQAIRAAGGKGTGHSAFYAFGLHLNIEPPDMQAATVAAYMKAFTCLFDWIIEDGQVDWSRRATPYIQRFPFEYERHLTRPDYWPDWHTLTSDYLRWNATRNRALDMLPMLLEKRPELVSEAVDDERVKGRPAFHYRLANCSVDEAGWSIAAPWGRWLQIEQLAADREALNECCAALQTDQDRLLHRVDDGWRKEVVQWLTT